MRYWYYAANGEEVGPIAESDLVQLFVQERLRASNLVWTDGLEEWQPASNFESLFSIKPEREAENDWEEDWYEDEDGEEIEWEPSEEPSDNPSAKEPAISRKESIRPWARFFARKIDIALFFMGLDFLYEYFDAAAWNTPVYQGVFLVIGFLCLEPLLLVAFGATPGKLILGLQLHSQSGGSISYPAALRRTLKVLVRGLALGIPFLHFFAQLSSLRDLNRNGETSWDREEGLLMEYVDFRMGRALLTAVVVVSLGVITLSFGLR